MRMSKLDRKQVLQLAAEAECDPRTVAKIYDGRAARDLVRQRVAKAAKKLRMPAPPVETVQAA